jgi:hypothetical protein
MMLPECPQAGRAGRAELLTGIDGSSRPVRRIAC